MSETNCTANRSKLAVGRVGSGGHGWFLLAGASVGLQPLAIVKSSRNEPWTKEQLAS